MPTPTAIAPPMIIFFVLPVIEEFVFVVVVVVDDVTEDGAGDIARISDALLLVVEVDAVLLVVELADVADVLLR